MSDCTIYKFIIILRNGLRVCRDGGNQPTEGLGYYYCCYKHDEAAQLIILLDKAEIPNLSAFRVRELLLIDLKEDSLLH